MRVSFGNINRIFLEPWLLTIQDATRIRNRLFANTHRYHSTAWSDFGIYNSAFKLHMTSTTTYMCPILSDVETAGSCAHIQIRCQFPIVFKWTSYFISIFVSVCSYFLILFILFRKEIQHVQRTHETPNRPIIEQILVFQWWKSDWIETYI